jgi:uncharacterized damage-inducible protein DinB
MSISADTLRLHIAYTTWATNRLLDAAAKLMPEELTATYNGTTTQHGILITIHN